MIPELIDIGASWKVLPPCIHDSTFSEIKKFFANNDKRKKLFKGLRQGCYSLKSAGCSYIYLDGSYVTSKPIPVDFDVCWDPIGVNPSILDPLLLDFSNARLAQKKKYGGEFFPANENADQFLTFLEYFIRDKETNQEKGIIRIQLN